IDLMAALLACAFRSEGERATDVPYGSFAALTISAEFALATHFLAAAPAKERAQSGLVHTAAPALDNHDLPRTQSNFDPKLVARNDLINGVVDDLEQSLCTTPIVAHETSNQLGINFLLNDRCCLECLWRHCVHVSTPSTCSFVGCSRV